MRKLKWIILITAAVLVIPRRLASHKEEIKKEKDDDQKGGESNPSNFSSFIPNVPHLVALIYPLIL